MNKFKKCKTCNFYDPTKGNPGICRRYPAKPAYDNKTSIHVFPVMYSDDWCGEWEKAE